MHSGQGIAPPGLDQQNRGLQRFEMRINQPGFIQGMGLRRENRHKISGGHGCCRPSRWKIIFLAAQERHLEILTSGTDLGTARQIDSRGLAGRKKNRGTLEKLQMGLAVLLMAENRAGAQEYDLKTERDKNKNKPRSGRAVHYITIRQISIYASIRFSKKQPGFKSSCRPPHHCSSWSKKQNLPPRVNTKRIPGFYQAKTSSETGKPLGERDCWKGCRSGLRLGPLFERAQDPGRMILS